MTVKWEVLQIDELQNPFTKITMRAYSVEGGDGCIVQTITQTLSHYTNAWSSSESSVYVPGVRIINDETSNKPKLSARYF